MPVLQAKLEVGAPNHPFRGEAERVADGVIRMAEPQHPRRVDLAGEAPEGVQRVCAECEEEVRRQPIVDENERLQMKSASAEKPAIGAGLQAQITGLSGGGQPLSGSLRSFFEPRFGADFSRVRIHTGNRAAALTRDLRAKAFTSGDNIVFGEQRYQPVTASGRWLLAHELTHTIQQSGANGRPNAQRMIQRATCEHEPPPGDMECTAAESSPPATPVETIPFAVNEPEPSPDGAARIERFLEHWHQSGAMDLVRVDGFASCDGSPGFNWRLSCSRARAVASILQTSRPGVQPLPDTMLEIFANGESEQFSTSDLSPNRVVTIAINPTQDYIPPPTPTLPQSPAGAAEAHPCTVKPDPDPATYCRPFRSTRVAELDRDERGHLVHAAAVASAQGHPVAFNLFMKYIWGGSNKVEDASAGAKAFTRSKTTEHVTKKLIEDALAMLWHDRENVFEEISQASQGQISLPVTPFQRWAVNDMRTDYALYFCLLNLPGIIAGGIGKAQTSAKNLGADTTAARNDFRDVTGHFDVDAVRHGVDEFHITVIPHLHYYVVDTIDFCPGASGGWFAEWLTNSMPRWEASGISGDVTFDLEFEAPDLVGEITIKRQNGAVKAVDPSIVGP